MYAFFTAGTVINFVLMIATPLALRSRLFSLGLSLLGAISAILIAVAAIIATAISVAAKVALTAQDDINIKAEIGIKMFVFMWIAAVLTVLAFILHAAMGCCCKPGRSGRSQDHSAAAMSEKGRITLPSFVRRRKVANGSSNYIGTTTE